MAGQQAMKQDDTNAMSSKSDLAKNSHPGEERMDVSALMSRLEQARESRKDRSSQVERSPATARRFANVTVEDKKKNASPTESAMHSVKTPATTSAKSNEGETDSKLAAARARPATKTVRARKDAAKRTKPMTVEHDGDIYIDNANRVIIHNAKHVVVENAERLEGPALDALAAETAKAQQEKVLAHEGSAKSLLKFALICTVIGIIAVIFISMLYIIDNAAEQLVEKRTARGESANAVEVQADAPRPVSAPSTKPKTGADTKLLEILRKP